MEKASDKGQNYAPTIAVGILAVLLGAYVGWQTADVWIGLLAVAASYIGLGLPYQILAWICGWPNLSWEPFVLLLQVPFS